MSSVYIIVAIIIILSILVCGAFIAQAVQHRKEQRNRLLAALKAKSRKFKAILACCPAGFLSRDLTMLVLRSLIDASEKLSRLEPSQSHHSNDIQIYSAELSDIQQKKTPEATAPITNPVQIKEIKVCLEELSRYVENLESKQTLPAKQAIGFKSQIKFLLFKLAIDLNELQAQAALDNEKPKLAIHHYEVALSMILKNAKNTILASKIPKFQERIQELTEHESAQKNVDAKQPAAQEQSAKTKAEWDKFDNNDDSWQKKNVYD